MAGILRRADSALGDRLEQLLIAHHHRRFRRIGQLAALDPPVGGWASGEPPPRGGNALDVLVDGAVALPEIAAAIQGARSYAWLAGWYFSPGFRLLGDEGQTLRELLRAAAERVEVRVLAWAGAPLPLFHPDRREVREARSELVEGTRIAFALDDHERPFHCHHEKVVVVDGTTAFVGGIDLTTLGGDRFDGPAHRPRRGAGWHDATTRLRGPAVGDVAEHFRLRWREVTGEQLPSLPEQATQAGNVEVQVVRTVPERIYDSVPNGEFRILDSYLRALRSAQRLVYLENQFLWSPEIVSVLVDKLRRPPSDEFRLLVLLPTKPQSGEEDTRGQLAVLAGADGDRSRFLACTLQQLGGTDQVYVHAKIAIVDDRWLTIGSANLNEHSLFNDTEVNVATWDERLARATRLRLWAEHLECDPEEIDGDAAEIVDTRWRPRAEEGLERRRRGEPATHKLVLLPGVSRRAARLLGPLNGFLVDG